MLYDILKSTGVLIETLFSTNTTTFSETNEVLVSLPYQQISDKMVVYHDLIGLDVKIFSLCLQIVENSQINITIVFMCTGLVLTGC